jgi:hypothetical protein
MLLSPVKVHVKISFYSLEKLEDTAGAVEKNIFQNILMTEEMQEIQLTGTTGKHKI